MYDPQTNGHAEGAVRLLKGMFRTLLLGLEKQIQGRLPLDHPSLAWLVSHAAHVRNLRVVGADGKTGVVLEYVLYVLRVPGATFHHRYLVQTKPGECFKITMERKRFASLTHY